MKSHEDVASKDADDRRTSGIHLFPFGDKVRAAPLGILSPGSVPEKELNMRSALFNHSKKCAVNHHFFCFLDPKAYIVLVSRCSECKDCLPTLGENRPHSRGNVGKYFPYMEHLGTDISLPLPSELKATLVRWQWSSCSARSHERQMAGADGAMVVFPGLLQMIIMGISMTSLPGNSQPYYRIEGFLTLTPLLTMRIKGYPNELAVCP